MILACRGPVLSGRLAVYRGPALPRGWSAPRGLPEFVSAGARFSLAASLSQAVLGCVVCSLGGGVQRVPLVVLD